MVVKERLELVRDRISAGHVVSLSFSAANEKLKAKIIVHPVSDVVPTAIREQLLLVVRLLESSATQMVTVDRGHRFSTGIAKAAFWMQPRANAPSQRKERDGGDGDDDEDDDDDKHDNPGDDRPHSKFKRPPRDSEHDPWYDGGLDPWGGSADVLPRPSKSGRTRISAEHVHSPDEDASDFTMSDSHDDLHTLRDRITRIESLLLLADFTYFSAIDDHVKGIKENKLSINPLLGKSAAASHFSRNLRSSSLLLQQ
jgi:hypothetical protein